MVKFCVLFLNLFWSHHYSGLIYTALIRSNRAVVQLWCQGGVVDFDEDDACCFNHPIFVFLPLPSRIIPICWRQPLNVAASAIISSFKILTLTWIGVDSWSRFISCARYPPWWCPWQIVSLCFFFSGNYVHTSWYDCLEYSIPQALKNIFYKKNCLIRLGKYQYFSKSPLIMISLLCKSGIQTLARSIWLSETRMIDMSDKQHQISITILLLCKYLFFRNLVSRWYQLFLKGRSSKVN